MLNEKPYYRKMHHLLMHMYEMTLHNEVVHLFARLSYITRLNNFSIS